MLLSELLTNHPGSIIPIFLITRQRLAGITARSFDDLVCFGAFPTWCRCRFRLTSVKRSHHSDTSEYRRPVALGNRQQRLHGGLPFFGVVFGLRQLGDVERGVAERDELLALRQRDGFIEMPLPSFVRHQ